MVRHTRPTAPSSTVWFRLRSRSTTCAAEDRKLHSDTRVLNASDSVPVKLFELLSTHWLRLIVTIRHNKYDHGLKIERAAHVLSSREQVVINTAAPAAVRAEFVTSVRVSDLQPLSCNVAASASPNGTARHDASNDSSSGVKKENRYLDTHEPTIFLLIFNWVFAASKECQNKRVIYETCVSMYHIIGVLLIIMKNGFNCTDSAV